MKNAILFKVNSFLAYMTVNAVFSYSFAAFLLSLQTKINDFFDYNWSEAVDQYRFDNL
jgi:hypothetical protein